MGIFGYRLTRKKTDRPITDDATRQLALETRQANAEMRRRKQELELLKLEKRQAIEERRLELEQLRLEDEIAELRGEDEEEEQEDSMEQVLLMQLLNGMNKNSEGTVQNIQPVQTDFKGVDLDDATIEQALNSFPKSVLKKLKGFSDEQLKDLIKTRIGPYASAETLNKIVLKYRENFK